MPAIKSYAAHLDAKKRLTLRGAKFDYYEVKAYDNGCYVLEPRKLVAPFEISAKTLSAMDEAVANFKQGSVSEPVDLSDFTV